MISRNEVTLCAIISILTVPRTKGYLSANNDKLSRYGYVHESIKGLDYHIESNKKQVEIIVEMLKNPNLTQKEIEGGNHLKKQFEEKYNYYKSLKWKI